MKKTIITTSCTIVLVISSINIHAELVNGSSLLIESGSYFDLIGQTLITGVDGVILGSLQPYDFSFSGDMIDQFTFLGTSGMHYTTSPTNILSSNDNTAAVDFSGWSWAFNGAAASFNLGSGSWGSNPDGVAEIICDVDCGNGDTYTLFYTATVPENETNGYAGFTYELHLTGSVSTVPVPVPVPATAWLFGSGLICIIRLARRKA